MRGINKVILVGTLGRDPEQISFPNGGLISNFSIATSEVWTDKNTGERREQTEWHRIVASNRLAEIAEKHLKKGSKVYVEGSLRTRKWTDQNGQEKVITEVRAETFQMLDSRNQNTGNSSGYGQNANNSNAGGGYGQQRNAGYGQTNQNGYGNTQQRSQNTNQNGYGVPPKEPQSLDDNLPF